jgi:hypothetical protein
MNCKNVTILKIKAIVVLVALLFSASRLPITNAQSTPCRAKPPGGVYAELTAGGQPFYIYIIDSSAIKQSLSLWKGRVTGLFPIGTLVCRSVAWNCGWSWHLNPESVRFTQRATEVCDGHPSDVEANCTAFGGGRFCPWDAKLINLRDCRTDSSKCPQVPR